jgi:hypothetical protein
MTLTRTLLSLFAAAAVTTTLLASAPATAITYQAADFSGQLSPGNANVKAPFNSVITQGGPVSGGFVFAPSLIPSPGTGFVNVMFSSLPDIDSIPPEDALFLNLGGGITFDLADALPGAAAIQYNNGVFNGFFFVSDFLFQGTGYELNVQGRTFNIRLLANGFPSGSNLVNGTLNIPLTNIREYDPTPAPVPEPGTLALVLAGLGAMTAVVRRRTR